MQFNREENIGRLQVSAHDISKDKFNSYFLIALKSRIERNSEYLTSKKIIIDQIAEIGDQLNEFMGKTIQEMEDLKTLLTSLSKEIESSYAEKFEKQTKELNDQENAANTLRKESQKQLSETKSILENASKELKALSSRDLAIIKTMNHPPHGVVLVVSAMCNQLIDQKEMKLFGTVQRKFLTMLRF